MGGKDRNSQFIKNTVIITAVLIVAYLYVQSLVNQTADVINNRKWWLYPVVILQWLIVGPVLVALAIAAAILLGYLLDFFLFFGIDCLSMGQFGAAAGWFAAYAVVLLVVWGIVYEAIRQSAMDIVPSVQAAIAGVVSLVLAGCGTVIYIHSAISSGLPVFHL